MASKSNQPSGWEYKTPLSFGKAINVSDLAKEAMSITSMKGSFGSASHHHQSKFCSAAKSILE